MSKAPSEGQFSLNGEVSDVPADHWNLMVRYIENTNIENANGSERGSVLVWASVLDDLLRRILDAHTADIPDKEKRLFGPHGAFYGFSNRINSCHGLGLVSADEASAMHLVRTIRNDQAHELNVSLSAKNVMMKIDALSKAMPFPHNSKVPRLIFQAACMVIALRLLTRLSDATAGKASVPFSQLAGVKAP